MQFEWISLHLIVDFVWYYCHQSVVAKIGIRRKNDTLQKSVHNFAGIGVSTMVKTSKCSKFGLFSRYFICDTLSGLLRCFLERPPQFVVFSKHSGILKGISNSARLISQRYVQFVSEYTSDLLYFEL